MSSCVAGPSPTGSNAKDSPKNESCNSLSTDTPHDSPRTRWADLSDDEGFCIVMHKSEVGKAAESVNRKAPEAAGEVSEVEGDQFWAFEEANMETHTFIVQLDNIPKRMCSNTRLNEMLHAGDFKDYKLELSVPRADAGRRGATGRVAGSATIRFTSWEEAASCYEHFAWSCWANDDSLQVTMTSDWEKSLAAWPEGTAEEATEGDAAMLAMSAEFFCAEAAMPDEAWDASWQYGGGFCATAEAHEEALALARAHASAKAWQRHAKRAQKVLPFAEQAGSTSM